ncbi:hypothetical protein EJ07DRAFT_169585 [Lizonia empirigonia]|nr:hypothetical protein EJ07DRAFT_169585 [Lizonia empirigonia]
MAVAVGWVRFGVGFAIGWRPSTTTRLLPTLFPAPKTPFQIPSDLHLSHASQHLTFHLPAPAPYLLLAGNTGRLRLPTTAAEVPGTNVVLLGATLWSAVARRDEDAGWGVEKHNSEHERDLGWLREEVGRLDAVGEKRQVLVVTAFAPDLRALNPWEVDAPWAPAYGTDLLSGGECARVRMWVCGTTGRSCEFKKGGVTVVSNQRGREDETVTGVLEDGLSEKQKVGLFDVTRVIRI